MDKKTYEVVAAAIGDVLGDYLDRDKSSHAQAVSQVQGAIAHLLRLNDSAFRKDQFDADVLKAANEVTQGRYAERKAKVGKR